LLLFNNNGNNGSLEVRMDSKCMPPLLEPRMEDMEAGAEEEEGWVSTVDFTFLVVSC
jgi:hypothetical protein